MWVKDINELKNSSPKILNYWMTDEMTNQIELPRHDNSSDTNNSKPTKIYTKLSSNSVMKK
jgi:hypothetical protein